MHADPSHYHVHSGSPPCAQIMFCSGVWSYFVAAMATPTFILVPVLTIWFGIFPIVLSFWAAAGLTVYYVATTSVRSS